MRPIDADALIDFLDIGHLRHPDYLSFSKVDVANLLLNAPTADVAPVVHGRWVHDHYENCSERFEIVKCSCCGNTAYAIAVYVKSGNYCPNCGAKMDGERKEDKQ